MAYETSDLYAAGALKVALRLSFPIIRLNGRMSAFVFEVEPTEAQRVVTEFYNDSLHVPARQYGAVLRDLKSLIFQAREGRGR